jgi:hypothetical protein
METQENVTYIDTTPAPATVEYVIERIQDEGRRGSNGIKWFENIDNDLLVAYCIGTAPDFYTLRYTDIGDGVLVAYVNEFGRATKDAILYTRESVIAHVLGNSKAGYQTPYPPLDLRNVPAPVIGDWSELTVVVDSN